ncbi:MAG: L-histidine N(alpha)-methyltransferase [Planctomycetota bacterium]
MEKFDFFIAYAKRDSEVAEKLYNELRAHAAVFFDKHCLTLGDSWDLALVDAVKNSRIIVVLVSEQTKESYFEREEIQAAIRMARRNPRDHRVIPVYIDATIEAHNNFPYGIGILQGLLLRDYKDLSEVAQKLLDVLKSTTPINGWRLFERGGFYSGIFDSTIDTRIRPYLDYESHKKKLLWEIKEGRTPLLDEKLLYVSPFCARRWLDVCKNADYKPYVDSRQLLEDKGKDLMATVFEESGAESFNIISLGAGNGEKDRILLHYLTRVVKEPCFYYPIDVSHTLLLAACEEVASTSFETVLRIKSIHDDFERLHELMPIYQYRTGKNIFALLGNTLGNYNEEILISNMLRGMESGDYLLLEVQLKSENKYEAEKKQFFEAPLRTMGFAVDNLRLEMRSLTGEAVPDSVTSYTHVILKDGSRFQLTLATQYDIEAMKKWLRNKKLNTLLCVEKGTVAIILTRYEL